jgi:3-oxoacyl-[acyl-carrier protein] reductase/meso-butanediol dehydrogenase/(S,S)-butanediol dehydrogenase/diacetyl reductase
MAGLEGKVALITGAGGMRGVGRATALKLAGQGADIALTDVRREPDDLPPAEVRAVWRAIDSVSEEITALGSRCLPIYCDLGYSDQIQDMVNRVMEHYGRIDILVNNARAIVGRDKVPVTDLPEEVWDHFLAINTTAVFLCTKMVGRKMVRMGNGGRIINIASDAAKRANALGAAYSASKFAVLGLTQASALDLAPYGITVNAVCPGPINTGRLSYWERARAEESGVPLEEFRATIVEESGRATPLGRIAEPEDIADMVGFLSSDEAHFITGQAYNVNGGLLFH